MDRPDGASDLLAKEERHRDQCRDGDLYDQASGTGIDICG
jgi:hypothetical protein